MTEGLKIETFKKSKIIDHNYFFFERSNFNVLDAMAECQYNLKNGWSFKSDQSQPFVFFRKYRVIISSSWDCFSRSHNEITKTDFIRRGHDGYKNK